MSSPTGPPAVFFVSPTNFCRLGKIHVFSHKSSLTAPMVVSGESDVSVMRSLAHLAIKVMVGVLVELVVELVVVAAAASGASVMF